MVSVETITPEMALKILDGNDRNRLVRPLKVNEYARDMASGNWKFTGDSIKLNGSRVLDGQHRLLACVQANVSFETVIVRGITEDAHPAIDAGIKRTMSDELRWRDCTQATLTAAVLNLLWRWKTDITNPATGSRNELLALRDALEHLEHCVLAGKRVYESTRIPATTTATLLTAISEKTGNTDLGDEWATHLARGTGYTEMDSALALRKYALQVRTKTNVRPRQEEWLAISIKAFNAWCSGTPVKILMWRRVGRGREDFPSLVIPTETDL